MTIRLLYIPCPSIDTARSIATSLLAERLAACCNLLPGMESHYEWEGRIETGTEALLIVKTTPEAAADAAAHVAALHPYDCPAILTFAADANLPFAQWVNANTITRTKA